MMGDMKRGKVKKTLFLLGLSLVALYLVGGVIGAIVVPNAILGHRGSDNSGLRYRIYKNKEDYPSLSNGQGIDFLSDGNTLRGHLYQVSASKGVVLYAHGMNSSCLGPECLLQDYFVTQGYDVFAFDLTAHGDSEGAKMGDFYQSVRDMKSAYETLQKQGRLHDESILCGYSWGGFAAAMCAKDLLPDRLVTFSAFDDPYELMLSSAVRTVGPIAYATVPPFALGTLLSGGTTSFAKASESIPVKTKVFAFQGKNDGTVSLDTSFARHMEGKGTTYYSDAMHFLPWLDSSAGEYVATLEPNLLELENKPKEEQEYFLSTIDKNKSSARDAALFESLTEFLSK